MTYFIVKSQLWHIGSQRDEFDSSGGLADDLAGDETPPEILRMPSAGGLAAMQQDLERRMREMEQQIESRMPTEIREIQQRIRQGTASREDIKRRAEWGRAHSKQWMADIHEMTSAVTPSVGRQPPPEIDLQAHVERLRPILPQDVTEDAVLEVLAKQAVFAEQILADFMGLFGVQPFFANLSYRYLEECTESDLLGAGINLLAHLKFRIDAALP